MTPRKNPKLSDIAKDAGVSIALVSYVLNNRHPDRIKKETAHKIRAIAKKLNYRPNPLAKGLKTKKSGAIGIVLADLANPFSAQIARIIEDNVRSQNYILLIGSMDEDLEKFRHLIDTFTQHQVEGLIIVPCEGCIEEIKAIKSQGIPYVLIDRYFPSLSFNYVANDNYYSTVTCVSKLIENGRKNIGFITQKTGYYHLQERKRGFIEACRANGLNKDGKIKEVCISDIDANISKALTELLEDNPDIDALLFATNIFTLSGLKYATKNKLKVPEKIQIMGFDEVEYYEIFPASISYFKQPLEEMGKKAVDFLISEITNSNQKSIQEILKGELIVV
ncbi:LacI family DNA-binding transcriptional regulator [Ascidiimonas sp. W6]|uniref:LacI family DNA-binding transcriptional regulator n=1 Tax=Ascidiimonas meishanensis TaxID=3128903 RepID=UPI0030EF5BE4